MVMGKKSPLYFFGDIGQKFTIVIVGVWPLGQSDWWKRESRRVEGKW